MDKSFVTVTINVNSDGISHPHTYTNTKKVIDKIQEYGPKNIILAMEPLDFISDLTERNKLFKYFQSQKNLYLNKITARNELASFGKDPIFSSYDRFITFYKCSDDHRTRENRRALLALTASGEADLFNDLKRLGYQPKAASDFTYSFEYWNSVQIFLKNYPLGTFGNYQTKDIFSHKVDPDVFKNKTVIIGTNDEQSFMFSRSTFVLFGMKKELDYQKNWVPLQEVLANNLSHLTTGLHIKLIKNIDDLAIVLLCIFLIVILPLNFEKRLYLFLLSIPFLLLLQFLLYGFGTFYIDLSRSYVVLVLGQYFIVPIVLLWKFRKQEEERYAELNKIRIDALISVAEHVAHDLRSPLSTINLLLHKATFQNQEHREIFKSALNRIDQIVEEILNSAKSKRNAGLQHLNLSDVISSAIAELRIRFPAITFQLTAHGPEIYIFSDRVSLIRILNNLAQNSAQAMMKAETLNPTVAISVETKSSFTVIKVADNGPGIRPEILEILGSVKVKTATRTSGFGIGVLYSKKLIEELGGTLEITSETGTGTTVSLKFPAK